MPSLHAEPQSRLSSPQAAGPQAGLPSSCGPSALSALSPALARVFDDSARSVAAQVQACLGDDADALLALLPAAARAGSPDGYTRHLIYADPMARFSAMLLVWRPGQASPVHGHRTWCAYRVLQGSLYERHYRWDEAAQVARPSGGVVREPGAVFSVPAGLGHIHSLGHAGRGMDRGMAQDMDQHMDQHDGEAGDIAVSLHLYGVEAAQIATGINLLVATG
ncbi:cysteine dioxygenase [Cupriavidus gilardii]|uniref:cysteine dioxygenase family protein n=1 Tax=Cupriavidus sp. DB3 TaxID=2873259 RepID=UPI0011EC9C5D|nr:cysteine dioxygenase family protein [Cupriavidus sp. DB3]KAA0180995.1 cysteine dioxygenase [Cupriavidus gilardii]MCA7085611.1 cysteine dioxygenase family protein [Cupriavidus sp. DB3]